MFKKTKLILKAFLMIAVIVLAASSSFAAEAPEKIKRIDTMIAVFDLETTGKIDKDTVRALTDSIRLELVRANKWEMIDRSNMDKILGEQKLQLSGCVSGECIVEAGQLLGVGKIITGSISMVGKTYYLSLSLVNVETGKTEKVSDDKCKCEIDDLIDSSKRLVKRLLAEEVVETKTTPEPEPTPKPAETKNSVIASEIKQTQKPSTTDTSGIEMVFVKGGCYHMGDTFGDGSFDEKPVHEVCVDDFYIGKYEVTQDQWKAVMGSNPSYFKDCGDSCPVENVDWDAVNGFIDKLNQKIGKTFRLPTEGEWEYAAHSGGKKEEWSGTSNKSELGDYAWYDQNSGRKPHPVGQKKPNGLGIYDMSGNVLEWVYDLYDENYYRNSLKNNPANIANGNFRVVRGGSWSDNAKSLRSVSRQRYNPRSGDQPVYIHNTTNWYHYFGVRVAMSK